MFKTLLEGVALLVFSMLVSLFFIWVSGKTDPFDWSPFWFWTCCGLFGSYVVTIHRSKMF